MSCEMRCRGKMWIGGWGSEDGNGGEEKKWRIATKWLILYAGPQTPPFHTRGVFEARFLLSAVRES